MRRWLNRGIDS